MGRECGMGDAFAAGGPGPGSSSRGAPAAPLGRLTVSLGDLRAVQPAVEELAKKAAFTRKVSVLCAASGASAGGLPEQAFARRLQLQHLHFELHGVSVAALGDQGFTSYASNRGIVCLSRGAGLHSGNVFGILPSGVLLAAVNRPTFERLGAEQPSPGSAKLQEKLLPPDRRHLSVDMGLSKTRAKRAPLGEQPTCRWRSLAPPQETCSLAAYCNPAYEDTADFSAVLAPGGVARQMSVPTSLRRLSLGTGALSNIPIYKLVCEPQLWDGDHTAELAEDVLDWIGGVHLGCNVPFDSLEMSAKQEEAWLWTMGETLTGSRQILHSLAACIELIGRGAPWVILSVWGTEDAPMSHHGGAHDFDLHGSYHFHLILAPAASGTRCLLLESTNALSSSA